MQQQNENKHNKISRRTFLQALTGATLVAACAAPATPAPVAEEGSTTAEGITISWWNQFSTATTQEIIPQIIQGFEEQYPGVMVEYEISGGPPGGGNFNEVLLARIAAQNPPNTATLWDPPVQFAARGSLTAIDDYMENATWATPDAFFEGPLNSCRWQGATYGLPASAGAGCIFINTEKFAERGLPTSREEFPTTWDGVRQLSAQLTEWTDGEMQSAGFIPWATPWLRPVWSGLNGSQIYDAQANQYTIDTEENIAWVDFWLQWLDEQYQGDVDQLNFYGDFEDPYPDGAFSLGLTSMVQSGSWACSDAEIPFEWEVVQFPVGPSGSASVTGYWPNWWAIPTGAGNVDESFLFSEWFCTRGWEIWYRRIMDTPAWTEFPTDIVTEGLIDAVGEERAFELNAFFAEYLTSTVNMWNSPVENFASDTLGAGIDEALHKTKSAAEALAEAQSIVQARLEETLQG